MYSDEKEYVNFIFDSGIIISNEQLGEVEPLPQKILSSQDWDKINREYMINNYVVIDNYLHSEYLNRIRNFVLHINKRHDYYGEYAAVNFHPNSQNTFWFPILSNIVIESKTNLECLEHTEFNRGWAFIYNQICNGIPLHVDANSNVTLNLWVTPEDCLLSDENHNGLIIYNNDKEIIIPYKCNRLVIFDSKKFHKSQNVRSKTGYTNKRINFAFLFENA